MFTGIIEELGKVKSLIRFRDRMELSISCKFAKELQIGDSVSVNGTCLTVSSKQRDSFTSDIIAETYKVTNLNYLKVGDFVNLERALSANGRFNGHFVQGHIDTRAMITNILSHGSNRDIEINIPDNFKGLLAQKGSIAVDGVSLTVSSARENKFNVSIIPHTALNTNLFHKRIGDYVNLEFDIIAKYLSSLIGQKGPSELTIIKDVRIDEGFLKQAGLMN